MRIHRQGLGLAVALLGSFALAPAHARAQSAAEAATRRALLAQAQQASDAGNPAVAIGFAERAGRIAMTPSIRYFLARELRAAGRAAEALGNAELCIGAAQRDTGLHNRDEILAECRLIRTELGPLVSHLVVTPPSPPPRGLEIRIGDAPLGEALWGVPYVVTPGDVMISATAPGYTPFQHSTHLAPGATEDVIVGLDALASSSPPPDDSSVPNAAGTNAMPHGAAMPQASMVASDLSSPLPVAVAGVGVASLVASAVIWLAVYLPAYGALANECGSPRLCANVPRSYNDFNTASAGWAAGVATVAGGAVFLAGGIFWAIVTRRPHVFREVPLAMRVGVAPTEGGGLLLIGGAL